METILWTTYLAVMIFIALWIVFDLIQTDSAMDKSNNRNIVYIIFSMMIAVWYIYFLH